MTTETCKAHSGLEMLIAGVEKKLDEHVKNNEDDHKEMWAAINNLRNRLPVWATVVISLLTAAVAWFAK